MEKLIGKWAFIVCGLLAVLGGLIPQIQGAALMWILIVLGLVVGFLNVKDKKATDFVIATIALMAIGAAGLSLVPVIGAYIGNILANIITFVAPAALVVALKKIYFLAK